MEQITEVGTMNFDINIKTQKHNLLPGPMPSMTEWMRETPDPSPAKYHNLGGEDRSPPVTEERTTGLDSELQQTTSGKTNDQPQTMDSAFSFTQDNRVTPG